MSQHILLGIGSFGLALIVRCCFRRFQRGRRVWFLRQAFRLETEARALTLLKEWLSPEQRACYERFRYFEVVGSHTGTRYRIHHGTQTNVEELSHTGQRVCKWCFVPEGNLVVGDVMLAQKIALETNERDALSVARRSLVSMGPRQHVEQRFHPRVSGEQRIIK